MKKLALLLCILMLFSIAACANNDGNVKDNNNTVDEKTEDKVEDVTDNNGKTNNNTAGNTNNTNNGNNQTLTGTAQGYGGEVKVTVEVNGDDIVKVDVVGEKETQGVGSNAIDQLPAKIEEADSTDVEVVSGATFTSNAIKEAVDKALEGIKK